MRSMSESADTVEMLCGIFNIKSLSTKQQKDLPFGAMKSCHSQLSMSFRGAFGCLWFDNTMEPSSTHCCQEDLSGSGCWEFCGGKTTVGSSCHSAPFGWDFVDGRASTWNTSSGTWGRSNCRWCFSSTSDDWKTGFHRWHCNRIANSEVHGRGWQSTSLFRRIGWQCTSTDFFGHSECQRSCGWRLFCCLCSFRADLRERQAYSGSGGDFRRISRCSGFQGEGFAPWKSFGGSLPKKWVPKSLGCRDRIFPKDATFKLISRYWAVYVND